MESMALDQLEELLKEFKEFKEKHEVNQEEYQQRTALFLSESETLRQTESLIVDGLALLASWDLKAFFTELQRAIKQDAFSIVYSLSKEFREKKQDILQHYFQMKAKGFLHFPCYTCKNAQHCPFGTKRIIFIQQYCLLFTELLPLLDNIQENIHTTLQQQNSLAFLEKEENLESQLQGFYLYFQENYPKLLDSSQAFLKIAKQRNKEKLEGKKSPPYVEDQTIPLPPLPL